MKKVYVIGAGVAGQEGFSPRVHELIGKADILFGGERQLELFPGFPGEKVAIGSNLVIPSYSIHYTTLYDIHDSHDRAMVQELLINCELAELGREMGCQMLVEGPGHMPLDEVETNIVITSYSIHYTKLYESTLLCPSEMYWD